MPSERQDIKVPDIVTPNHLNRIGDIASREGARLFLSLNNGHQRYRVKHEPTIFKLEVPGAKPMCTRPDLWLFDLDEDREHFLEFSTGDIHTQIEREMYYQEQDNGLVVAMEAFREVLVDPKARQKEIMKKAAPGVHYAVWYRKNMLAVQQANPGFNFFNGKNWKNGNNGQPNRNRKNGHNGNFSGK